MKILLLEDDIILAELIKEYLEENFYIITHEYSGEKAYEEIYTNKYDLLIFDINVPNITGLEVLKNFRNDGFTTPTIFLSASSNIYDIEKAYDLGGNDFIKKPFELQELKIRIEYIKKTLLLQSKDVTIINNNISFDIQNRTIIKNKKNIRLPKKEAQIICYFLKNKNRIISTDELIINIWDYAEVPTIATIRTYIKNIRKVLDHKYLETVKGIGYIFKSTR